MHLLNTNELHAFLPALEGMRMQQLMVNLSRLWENLLIAEAAVELSVQLGVGLVADVLVLHRLVDAEGAQACSHEAADVAADWKESLY